MFTGIVETLGLVTRVERSVTSASLAIEAPEILSGVALGASIAVNGCCLTVAALEARGFRFEAVTETLACTNLGLLEAGSRVNLERALRADGRFDGHFVQGHIDAVGRVRSLLRRGDDVRLAIGCEPALAELLVPKGSVAVDGVSLTLAGLGDDVFEIALIPYTLRHTTLGSLGTGAAVNLEADILGKYVRRGLERIRAGGASSPW